MEGWQQVTAGYWRKEAALPVGQAVAEIHQRQAAPLYDTRLEITVASAVVPQTFAKTSIALQSLVAAETECNRLLAELVAAYY